MRRRLVLALSAQLFALAGCSDGPASPQSRPAVTLAPSVAAAIVSCACTEGPTVWATVSVPVTIMNPGAAAIRIATIEARAFNQTRNSLISANVRPNGDFTYPTLDVPAGSSLTLDAGLVYHPLPPPQDDVRLVVVVTFVDGTTARAEARLLTGA